MTEVWKCPLCDFEIAKGEPFYYSYGTDKRIEALELEVHAINQALTHIIVKHLLEKAEKP